MKKILVCMMILALVLSCIPGIAEQIWKIGDSGERVSEIQIRLEELGYLSKDVTGDFDEDTEKALLAFQRNNGLLATGMADEITLTILFSEGAEALVPDDDMPWEVLTEDAYESGTINSFFMAVPVATGMPLACSAMKSSRANGQTWNTNEYTYFRENGFQSVIQAPFSTFAADVDTASYAQLRSMILRGENVTAEVVRVEEMLNYFRYDYSAPEAGHPLGVKMELARCPWNPETMLLQIGLQAEEIAKENRAPHNLVFLIDVSGSMFGSDRLDLVKRAFQLMLEELEPTDTVSLVTYASRDEVVLSGVPAADKTRIMEAISGLEAGGSTNSAAGIQTAYQLAERYATEGSVNRILMATDGDFNVGVTSEGDLVRLVMDKKQAGVRLTMLGVGYGNYKDNKLEALADYGDGNYYYLDTIFEARRALVAEAGGTLTAVAKDVKLQLDFNPETVGAYRLIGYEDRVMAAQDFADDTKDGGEIGSGHRVTVLYEIVPTGSEFDPGIPESRYTLTVMSEAGTGAEQTGTDTPSEQGTGALAADWLTLSIRWKTPDGDTSTLEEYPFAEAVEEDLSDNMKWAAAIAECAMLLRESEYAGESSWQSALALARDCGTVSGDPYKEEFVYLLTLLERGSN